MAPGCTNGRVRLPGGAGGLPRGPIFLAAACRVTTGQRAERAPQSRVSRSRSIISCRLNQWMSSLGTMEAMVASSGSTPMVLKYW